MSGEHAPSFLLLLYVFGCACAVRGVVSVGQVHAVSPAYRRWQLQQQRQQQSQWQRQCRLRLTLPRSALPGRRLVERQPAQLFKLSGWAVHAARACRQ